MSHHRVDKPRSKIRVDAETELAREGKTGISTCAPGELLHELQVHQVELEMQNEELRRAYTALEESRDRYVDLYEFAPVGYLTITDSGLISEINLAGAALLGEDRQKILQRRFARFLVPEDQDKWYQYVRQMTRYREAQPCELNFQGSKVRVSVNCQSVTNDNIMTVLRMSLTDITELHRVMAALLAAKDDHLLLAKNAAGLGTYDRDIASGTIEWDERTREIWGVGPEEVIRYQTFMAGVHPLDRKATQSTFDSAFEPRGCTTDPNDSVEYNAEYRVINRIDGIMRNISSYGRVYFEKGQAVRSVGVMRDISRIKQHEKDAQVQRSQMELLIKQQVAAQTTSAIAHELNQPLASLSLYSETALRMLHSGIENPEELTHVLESAVAQALRAGQKLHELIGFLNKGNVAAEPVNLHNVVQEALVIAAKNGDSDFHPVVEMETELPNVLANRLQLQKVLLNLISNGIDAVHGVGLMMMTTVITITVRLAAEKNMVQVTVRDSGPGLDAETVQRIFDPFFTTKPKGLGLGLAISRALIEAHGGQLWADLKNSPGATFHFTLPFAL